MTIHLRTLGSLDLRAADGREIRSLLAQPKRLALLAYLAASGAAFHRRDTLLALFWPESETESARASLRTALSVLRRSLGDGVVLTRGNEEVGVDPERLWCDVPAFEQTAAAGDPERALAWYRGDLLEGFHLDDAPEFERWLDARRGELRVRAAQAAWQLAEREEGSGNGTGAAQWALRALAFTSDDENALRRLIVLLDRFGDRAGSLRAYDAFAARLRAEFDAEPAPETQALIQAVRARACAGEQGDGAGPMQEMNGAGRAPVLPQAAPDVRPDVVDTEVELVSGTERRDRRASPTRVGTASRLVMLGAVAILAIAVTSLVFAPQDVPAPTSQRVAVTPFENHTGDPSLDPLGAMAADWISQGLMRTGLLEVVPISSVLFAVQGARGSNARDTLEPARVLAHQTGATVLVSGAFYQSGDSLQFHTRIVDARTGALLSGVDPVTGGRAEPLAAVEVLRSRVTGTLAARMDWRLERVQSNASPPPNWEAYHATIRGIEAFIGLRYADARTSFRRAADLDSTYAPALIFAAINHVNVGEWAEADSLAGVLSSRRHRLAPHDQHILDWLTPYIHGDRSAALRAVRQATTLVPTSEWLFVVGLAALQANRPAEAVATYARPEAQRGWAGQWIPFWNVLTGAHHMLGEHAQELEVAARARQRHPQSLSILASEIRALVALGRINQVENLLEEAALLPMEAHLTPAGVAVWTAQELRAHGHEEASRAALERALAWYASRPPQEQQAATQRFALATTLYEAGRWQDAQAMLSTLVAEQPDNLAVHGLLGVVAALNGDAATVAEVSGGLSELTLPYGGWQPLLWRARIEAAQGDHRQAMTLLTQAFARGLPHGVNWHADTALQPLRADPAFQRLLRPKG